MKTMSSEVFRRFAFMFAAAAAWIYVAASTVRGIVPVVERFLGRQPSFNPDWNSYFAWPIGLAILAGCVAAWDLARSAKAQEYLPPRSSLVVWPGWSLAALGLLAALVLGWLNGVSPRM